MPKSRKFLFKIPRNFVAIRKAKHRICRIGITVNIYDQISFFDCESGRVVSLEDVKRLVPSLPEDEREILSAWLEKNDTPEKMSRWWAWAIIYYGLGKAKRNCFSQKLAQEILGDSQ
jgi:hypothetical protein